MNPRVAALRREPAAALRERIVNGHRVDARALEGWVYRGESLGLPRLVERLTWKTFQKAFYRDPRSGRLLGWNVRLEQDGVDAPSRPKLRAGLPVTTWFFEVIEPGGVPAPRGFDRGLIIDYGRGPNPRFDTIRFTKDPLVALIPGDPSLLLGVSYLAFGTRCVETPTYFLLEREAPVGAVPRALEPSSRPPLTAVERRWAELLFDLLLGAQAGGPLLPRSARALEPFWERLASAPPAYFSTGLRAAVCALTFLPVGLRGLRRPVFALTPAQRLEYADRLERDERVWVQQLVSTLKVIACFALFEDDAVRRRFGAPR